MNNETIDLELQKLLRKPVSFSGDFQYDGNTIGYSINSDRGLVFDDTEIESIHTYGFVTNSAGLRLYYQYWLTDPGRPVIFFNHGNAENSSTHPLFIYSSIKKGYNFLSFDQQGFGESDGIRGNIDSFDEYVVNVRFMFDFLLNRCFPGGIKSVPPVTMVGFSLGGLLTLYWLVFDVVLNKKDDNREILNKINNIILLAPFLQAHPRLITPVNEILLRLLAPLFSKSKMLRQESQRKVLSGSAADYCDMFKNLSDNTVFLKRRFHDTRIHRVNSQRWLGLTIRAQKRLFRALHRSEVTRYLTDRVKISLICNEVDLVVSNDAIIKAAGLLGIPDCVTIQTGCYHEFLDYEDERGRAVYDRFFSLIN